MLKLFHKILGGNYEKGFKGLGYPCLDMCMGGGLLSVSCSNNSNSSNNNGGAPVTYIGSKKPTDTTWAVGDIVYNDGSADPGDATLDATKKGAAVAVIFDATNKKGVGLKKGTSLKWAPTGTTGCDTTFNTSDVDGSQNWAVIVAADSAGAAVAETNYPAFNFCNTYGVAVAGVSTGWYLPAKNELKALETDKDAVDASIGNIGESGNDVAKLTGYSLSSSKCDSSVNVWCIVFGLGIGGFNTQKNSNHDVRAVRKF